MGQITASMVKELREISGVGMMDCKKALVESGGDLEAAKDFLRKTGQAKALKKSSRETHEGGIGYFLSADKKKGALVKVACETDFVAKNERFQEILSQLSQHASEHGVDDFVNQPFQEQGTVQDFLVASIGELGENIQFLEATTLVADSGMVGGYVHMTGKIGVLVCLETDRADSSSELEGLAKDISMHIAATHAEAIREDQIDPEILEKEKQILIAQAKDSGRPEEIIEKMVAGRIKKFIKEICVLSQPFVKNPEQTIEALLKEASNHFGVNVSLTHFVKYQF